MTIDTQTFVYKQLTEGEELIWSGQPNIKRYVLRETGSCGCIWVTFVLMPLFTCNLSDISTFRSLGLPLLFLASVTIIFILVVNSAVRKARNTIYAVTNQRLLIMSADSATGLCTVTPEQINTVQLVMDAPDMGTIYFHEVRRIDGKGDEMVERTGFLSIYQPQQVLPHVQALAAEAQL